MAPSAKSRIDSKLASSQPDPDARPVTPEPTTASGVAPEHALYDNSPSRGSQSAEFRSGSRKRRSTERGGAYAANRNRAEEIREKGNWTRKRNNALRARITEPGNSNTGPNEQTTSQQPPHRRAPLPEKQSRGRSRTIRDLSRSPTPGSTDHELEPDEPSQPQPRHVYVYETLTDEALVAHAREVLGDENINTGDTQAILQRLQVAPRNKVTQMAPSRQPTSIVVLPAEPLQVGGGWHREYVESHPAAPRGKKRALDKAATSQESTKRPRNTSAQDAAEPETDDEPLVSTVPDTYPPPPSVASGPTLPSRESTPTTVLETLGQPVPPIPTILSPWRGRVHARLRSTALGRFFDSAERDAAAADATEDDAAAETDEAADASDTDADVNTPALTDPEEVPTQRTYKGARSHAPSPPSPSPQPQPQSSATTTAAEDDEDAEAEAAQLRKPSSLKVTAGQKIRRERARALRAKLEAELRDRGIGRPRPRRLFTEATEPPSSRPQARPPPGPSRTAPGVDIRGTRMTRRLDPVSAARNDMIRFNEARAQERATTFVESATRATRQKEREGPCAATRPRPSLDELLRPLNELLPDDEEALAQALADVLNKWPDTFASPGGRSPSPLNRRPSCRGRKRKQKPLARDISGLDRQVLTVAKIHIFAYALVQGIYQTRATFLRWAAAVHEATWEMELPTTPYVRPDDDVFEIMVNNLASLRGRVKERVRAFVESEAGFHHTANNQEKIQENLEKFNLRYPNNFHCKTLSPRRGHYENPEIAHCIAVLLFHGPNSVGMMYPDYFRDMPLTVVAFTLAIWQFGLEEWSTGLHQNGDLGMASMCEKYEAILAGLKELRDVAPRRMERLQKQWRNYVEEYSGATFKTPEELATQGSAQKSEMRPDTPEPTPEPEPEGDAISVEEMEERLFETARLASIEERMRELLDRHGRVRADDAAMDIDDDEQLDPSPPSRSPTPPPEFNEQGRLTARSKGKGRAN